MLIRTKFVRSFVIPLDFALQVSISLWIFSKAFCLGFISSEDLDLAGGVRFFLAGLSLVVRVLN